MLQVYNERCIFIDPKKVPVLFSCLITASFFNMSQPVANISDLRPNKMSQNKRFVRSHILTKAY